MMDTPPPSSNATPTPPPARRSHRVRWLITALIAIVLVVSAAGVVYHFYGNLLAKACVPSAAVRHTLPCDIPLLSDATFESRQTSTLAPGEPLTSWAFTTPESLTQLVRFYETSFRADGWSCVGDTVVGDLLAVAAQANANRPDSVAFMAFQINVLMSPNEFVIVLVEHASKQSPLPPSFKCGNLTTSG
jgi:hypothetical protein